MHVSLSDVLTCPACGPEHGLVLLTDLVEERRVVSGVLGCPNCRSRYPIRDGVADLRVARAPGAGAGQADAAPTSPAGPEAEGAHGPEAAAAVPPDQDAAVRLAAGLGLDRVRGVVALAGPIIDRAGAVARLTDQVEIVTLVEGEDGVEPSRRGWSILRVSGNRLPFRDMALAGVGLPGHVGDLLDDAVRALRPAGRLVLEPPSPPALERAREAGMLVILDAAEVQVLARRA
jgi:uncharacterized protein YbaR (Trm112 family)